MEITDDGKLIYTVNEHEKSEIINLIYKVNGNVLITDQPSKPKKEKTKFSFEANGQLLLQYGNSKSWFKRVTND
jgi:hypothetical protein